MIRRRAVGLLVPLCGLLALTGCATFDENDDAAVVEGTPITRDEYQDFLGVVAGAPDVTQLAVDEETDTVAGADGRLWLSTLVNIRLGDAFLAESGVEVTDADRQQVIDNIPEDDAINDAPEVRDIYVEAQAASSARARVEVPPTFDVEAGYNESPAGIGVVCARHIVVATEAEAEDVLAELDAGADFAELAADRSLDPSAADNGGVLTDGTGDCLPLSTLGQVPEFSTAMEEAGIGVPTQPVESSQGWHVLVARPYDEVADALDALFAEDAGTVLYDVFRREADVQVDPRYGRWDHVTSSVVAL